MIKELIETMKTCGLILNGNCYETLQDSELITLCVEIETTLFRARIKAERAINQK